MDSSQPSPSGSFLPYLLRKKWKAENEGSSEEPPSTVSPQHLTELYPAITRAEKSRILHCVFTAQEIENRMQQISKVVLVDIQKQIQKGEEAYYEDTNGHGNLFRGWDAFVDSKDSGVASASSVPQGTKRIPTDCRWFSASSRGTLKPARSNATMVKHAPASVPLVPPVAECPSNVQSIVDPKSTAPEKSSSSCGTIANAEVGNDSLNENTKEDTKEPSGTSPLGNSAENEDPSAATKRKCRDEVDQCKIDNSEPKQKRSRDNSSNEKNLESTGSSVALEGEAKCTQSDAANIDETQQDAPVEFDGTKSSNDSDRDVQKDIVKPNSPRLDEKTKQEETQKRRSSRSRRSS